MAFRPPTGKIHRLELENFKSYKGHQVIGPFYDFTAIIGPSGAGKSNLMDAISFVFGVQTVQLRGVELKDLIYRFDDKEKEQEGRRASVVLVYHMGNGSELQFMRTITSAGGSEYRIDGKILNWDEYNGKLKSLGILVEAHNFLVSQGDVESIASKNHEELTALLGQISGSDDLKRDCKHLEEQKARAAEKLALVSQKKITIEREQEKAQKVEAENHLFLQDKLKSLKIEHFLWQLRNLEEDITKTNEDLDAEKSSRGNVIQEQENWEREASKKKKEQAKYLKKIAQFEKKIAHNNNKLDKNQPELLKLKEEMAHINSKIKSSHEELDKRREEKRNHAIEVEKLQKDLQSLSEQLDDHDEKVQDGGKPQLADSQLKEYNRMLEYEQKRDMESQIANLESSLSAFENDLKQVQKKEAEAKLAMEETTGDIDNWEDEIQKWKPKSEECEKFIQEWKKQASTAATSIDKLERQINSKEAQIEQLKSRKQEILGKCDSDRISLPTISDPLEIGSSTSADFDFSQLRSNLMDMRPSEREKVEVEFKQQIDALISKIEKKASNLKALDQYKAVQEKERGVIEEFEAAINEEKEIADKFNSVKQKRYELFMEAFNHISNNVDKIYKQLTNSDTYPLGGTAYFKLENEHDPFLCAINYSVMPPTKRLRVMEQLSGEEKTVAALALLFSIHSYRPSPFFILDEVDAALDDLNVAKVAGFIQSKACEGASGNQDADGGSGFQSIVISGKKSFFSKAEALVGVYRDPRRSCSRTLTYDLAANRGVRKAQLHEQSGL